MNMFSLSLKPSVAGCSLILLPRRRGGAENVHNWTYADNLFRDALLVSSTSEREGTEKNGNIVGKNIF